MESLAQVHEGLAKQAELDAKAKEKALQAAQDARDAGLVGKAQQIASQVQAGTRKPTDQMIEMGQRWISKIKDPVERDKFAKTLGSVVDARRAEESYKTAGSEIERAMQDGVFPDEAAAQAYQQRLQVKQQRGEAADDVLTDLGKMRMERAAKATYAKENADAFEKARALADQLPPEQKRSADLLLSEYELSPSKQEEQGAGAKLISGMRDLLTKDAQNPREKALGLLGKFDGELPAEQDVQQAMDLLNPPSKEPANANSPKVADKSLFRLATTEYRKNPNQEDMALSLERQGYDLEDPAVQQMIQLAVESVRDASGRTRSLINK